MFATLGKRLSNAFSTIGNAQRLSEDTLHQAVREVKMALLEADVNYKVVKSLVSKIEERIAVAVSEAESSPVSAGLIGDSSSKTLLSSKVSLQPKSASGQPLNITSTSSLEQQFIDLFREELLGILNSADTPVDGSTGSAVAITPSIVVGDTSSDGETPPAPTTVLLLGLQGSGKTTAAAKIAHILSTPSLLASNGADASPLDVKSILLVGCDTHRPAARDQLRILSERVGCGFFTLPDTAPLSHDGTPQNHLSTTIALHALDYAQEHAYRVVVFDTAGRTHADAELMAELADMVSVLPTISYHLLVADAMLGQRGVDIAATFNDGVGVSGLILSKADSDAKGGIALSVRYVTGIPLFYISDGERIEDISVFHAERLVDRLLGRGDLLTLADKVQSVQGAPDEKDVQRIVRSGMDFNDLLTQMKTMRKMGGVASLMKLLPGMGGGAMAGVADMAKSDDMKRRLKTTEAIIQSMTPTERTDYKLLNGSRRRRIAKGSGVKVSDINRLVEQLVGMNKMMKSMAGSTPMASVAGASRRGKGKLMGKKARRQKGNAPDPGKGMGKLALPPNFKDLDLKDINLNDLNLNDLNKFIKP